MTTIAVSAMQGIAILCVLASAWLAWKVGMSAHDKIDWLKKEMGDREARMEGRLDITSSMVDTLHARVERLEAKLQERVLDAARVRTKKIGGKA